MLNTILEFLLRKIGAMSEFEKLVKVKSFAIGRDPSGLLGPTLLVDNGGSRQTVRRIYQGRIFRKF